MPIFVNRTIIHNEKRRSDPCRREGVTGQSRTPSLLFSQSCAFSSSDKKDAAPPGRCGGLTPGTLFFRKEEKQLNNLTKALMEELTVEYVKVGPLQIPESVVISWVIMAIVVIGSAYQKPEGGPHQQASGRAGNGLPRRHQFL